MSITLSSMRIAVRTVWRSLSKSSAVLPSPRVIRCATRLTEPRLQTAISSAPVLLRAAQVAGILEGDPGMPRLEQHRQHLAPQVHRRHLLVELELAARRL